MTTLIRARSLPYPPELRAEERVCPRCGIHFKLRRKRDDHLTHCRDCRGME